MTNIISWTSCKEIPNNAENKRTTSFWKAKDRKRPKRRNEDTCPSNYYDVGNFLSRQIPYWEWPHLNHFSFFHISVATSLPEGIELKRGKIDWVLARLFIVEQCYVILDRVRMHVLCFCNLWISHLPVASLWSLPIHIAGKQIANPEQITMLGSGSVRLKIKEIWGWRIVSLPFVRFIFFNQNTTDIK